MGPEQTVRWGDQVTLQLQPLVASTSSQVVNARRPGRPTTWTVSLYSRFIGFTPPQPGFHYETTFQIVYGAGAANVMTAYQMNIDSTVGVVQQSPNFLSTPFPINSVSIELPAESIQINVLAISLLNVPAIANVQIAAFVAPRYNEPDIEVLASDEVMMSPVGQEHWLPPGFNPIPTRYRK